jgi:hypothetical protein
LPAPTDPSSPPTVKVLYIAGSGRTGSTILDRVLGQFDGFFATGELCNLFSRGLVAKRRCGCGVPIPDCPTWSAILKEAFGDVSTLEAERLAAHSAWQLRPGRLPSLARARWAGRPPGTAEHRQVLAAVYRAAWRQTGCRVLVDSSKSPIYAALLDAIPGVQLHVVHLVRDPRATAFSFQRVKPLPDFGDDRQMITQTPLVTARRWALWQTTAERLWRRSGRYLLLRYEDFTREPRAAVEQILALLGEAPAGSPFVDDHTVRLGTTHSVSGNPNRFGTGDTAIRADDEWTRRMAASDRRLVTLVTWPLLLRYHYPLAQGRGHQAQGA